MKSLRSYLPILVILVLVVTAVLYLSTINNIEDEGLRASGTVEIVEVIVAPELPGRISDVLVEEGQIVRFEQPLFILEDDVLQAQRDQANTFLESAQAGLSVAETAIEQAEANLSIAEANVELAHITYQIELSAVRLMESPLRQESWRQISPFQFDLPIWYFTTNEQIQAAQKEVESAEIALEEAQEQMAALLDNDDESAFALAEQNLAQARITFSVAVQVLQRAYQQNDSNIQDMAQEAYDLALESLEDAQEQYNDLFDEETSTDIIEARAQLATVRERYETALDYLDSIMTGEESRRVLAAQIALEVAEISAEQASLGVEQAQNNLTLAEKSVTQAEAALALIDIQIEKLTITAPVAGIVLTRNIEPGEIVPAGGVALIIGQTDEITITVFVPEDRYGQISLGQFAEVTVDSFPGESFTAEVIRIADEAEFTPRNVQTEEGRRTTVFAIDLKVHDPDGKLKPGLPADVVFTK